MGQALTRVKVLVQQKKEEVEIALRRREDREVPGFPKLLTDNYTVGEIVHDGAHGCVYYVTKGTSKRPLVMKAMRKDQRSFGLLDVREHALAIEEIKSCQLRHDNICSYYGIFESRDLLCVVMECCDGGSVRKHLQEHLHLDDSATAKILKQILDGLAFLHSAQIVHRDVRPEQFLFASIRRKRLKLCDLLHSAQSLNGRKIVDPTKPSLFLFSAPESLTAGEYSKMSDMWSVGCCLYELLYGHPPFTGENKPLVRRIVEDEPDFQPLFSDVSKLSVELLRVLLGKQPKSRSSAREALAHEWFQKAQEIGQAQERVAAARETARQAMLQQLQTMQVKRNRHKAEESDDMGQLDSQISRSLTDSYSHLSCSTPSSEEAEEENVRYQSPASPWTALRDGEHEERGSSDSGSEDWQCESDRSDLSSGPPPSGEDESHSGTYANSEIDEYFARTKGYWDEFDSEFFEEDRQLSSCWSEAEFSDWTANDCLKQEHDRDFKEWCGPDVSSAQQQDGGGQPAQAALATAGSQTSVRSGSGSHRLRAQLETSQTKQEPPPHEEDLAGSRPPDSSPPVMRVPSLRSSDRLELHQPERAITGGGREDTLDSYGSGMHRDGSVHAADELELAARDRSEGTSASRSSQSLSQATSQSSSAPWEFTERSGTSSTSNSTAAGSAHGRSRESRDKAAAQRAVQESSSAQLATISEQAELTETLGDVTRRSLTVGPTGESTTGNFIVLSRRSNSSSSSSARDAMPYQNA